MNRYSHVLITGATGSIGAALAKAYASPNVHLSLLGRQSVMLEEIAHQCRGKGASISKYSINVKDQIFLQQTIQEIDNAIPVDLVIANAGVANYLSSQTKEEPWSVIQDLLDVNLKGAIATITPLILSMKNRGKGQIALMSSLAAYKGMGVSPAYCASKAGLKAYGESLRGLLRNSGVQVSVICPGFIKSNMSDQFPAEKPFLMSAEKAANIIKIGLQANKSQIAFPKLLNIGMKSLAMLPCSVSEYILQTLGYGVIKSQ